MGFAHRSEDNGQKFTPDHVYDLSASASFNIDSENPVSINIEDNDPLSMESVGTNDKEGICVPVSSEQSGPSSGASSVCVNALRTAEGSPVCSRSSSQGSSKKSAKAPEVVLTSHSASAPGEIANESNLNTGSREEEGPGQAQVMNCTDDVTNRGNTEVENIKGQSVDSFYGTSGRTPSDTKTFPLSVSEYDSQIDSSDSSSFCRSTDPVSSHVDDTNPLQLQQSSNVHGQTTSRMHESDESSSSSTDWERLGARPKISQRQRPRVAISPPPPPPIASPVSDGLAGDSLVRHSQDKAVHESLYANSRDFSFLGNETSQVTSFVDGKTNASEAYRVRTYFGACHAVAVGNKSYVRSDGSAFSDVSIGGFERVGLLDGSSNNESLYGSSAHAAAAPLRNQTGLSNVTLGWNGSSSNGVNNVDGFLNIDHGVTGQKDYSRESYFPAVQHNTHTHWQSNTVSEITRSGFAYGLTSSDFTLRGSGVAGIRPLPSVYTTQRHVMSDGDSAFKDEQAVNERSHNADLALGHQSLANINRHHLLGTSASTGSAVIVDNCGLPPPFSVSSSSVSSTTVVSTTTSRSLVVGASNHTQSLVNSTSRNAVVSSTTPGDGNSETSLAPSSRNGDEDQSRGALLNRDNGTNDIEPIDNCLLALERRVADASALVERVLREREEREQFQQEKERKERMIRERQERERWEREEREMQEAEQWPQQQEAVSALSPWLCEHYQRHCRVRFFCCTQFYPCYRCHNSSRNCENEEAKACHATHLKCSFCEHEQEIDENSGVCGKCGAKVAAYLCSICKHFTIVDKNPYHCEKCGICRIHAGKSCQCEVCNVCLDKRLEGNHECCPDSSHNECYNCFEDVRSCLLSDRNARPELEALNSVVPHIESIEEHSFPSSAFPSPSLNSLSVSLGDPFNQEEPCECSDEDLAAGCLAKAQSKPETKETHHYADVFQLKTELNGKENPDNCDSIDGVPKRPEEPLGESNECPDMQIGVNHHPQCQNSLEEMEVSAANDIGVRTPTNSGLDPFMLSKDEESATFQNNSFELLEQINELKEQLRQREAENQQLRAEVGRYLFLEDREKRSGKLLSVPREIASDESISWRASASFKCGTTNGRHLGGAASLQDNPDFNTQARFIDISNSLSAEEFKQMKTLARGKVDGFRLAKMKVGFELLKEVERVSEHPCTDIGELLKGIQRFDLLEKLGLPYPESKTSVCAGTSSDSLLSRGERLEDLEKELDKERCATQMSCKSTLGFAHRSEDNSQTFIPDHDCDLYASVSFESDGEDPVSINIEDNDLLPKDKVGASVKEGIFVPNCRDRSGPLSGGSSISVSSSDSLALISAESTPVCSTSSSQGSFEKSAKAPELSLTTHSASARGEIVNESDLGLNTGNSEERERESNECPDMQIKVQRHPQRQNSLEEIEVSAANGIGVRTPTNSGLDPFMLSKDEESATSQNNCFELLEQINELKEQLRQSEAENQQLKAEVGQYLFLEDREKRNGKLLSVPRVSASDDSKSCGASASSKCVTTNGRPLGGAESAGTSTDCVPSRDERLQDLEPEQDQERCANHVSINMMDNDPLSMESVGTNAKESICVPNSPNKSGPSSDCSNISVSSSDSLVLSTAQGTTVCSSSSSQGSSEKSAKAPEVALTTRSAVAPGEIANEGNLNTGSSEEEVPVQAQLLNSTNDLTDGGNIEVGDIEGQSLDLCYGASGTSRSNTRSPLSECDLQISSSDSYAFCPLADPENSHVDDGNLVHLQQSSNAHGQTTLGMNGSDAANSSSTDWERLGARPKSSQTQRSQVAISPPPPPLIGSPVSVGLAGDFVVRHSEDKADHESLFSNGRDFSFLGNDTSQGASFVEGSTNASEGYRVRPCFGACQVAVGNNSYVRSDGNAFSHVPGGDFERARLLAGISYNESLYGISPPTAVAPLTIPTGPSNVTMDWNGSSRDGANNGDGFLNTDHRVTGQRDYSRESYFPYVQHNTHVGQVPIHWQSNANSRITSSGFAYGLTSSGFTFGPLGSGGFAGVRPRQSLHATQRHVVSDGDSVFIDEQSANEMSHDVDLALGRQSLANRNHELPTSAGSAVIVDNCGLPLPLSVSAYSINSTRGISATTSHPLVVSASNGTRGLDNNASRNSVVSSATPVDENAETSLAPVSVNVNENNSRGALLNRDNGTNYIEPIDDSLLALERRVADASALAERMLREREEREQFAQGIERRERRIRERRERERREREEREIPDGVRWLQEQEDTSFGTPTAL
ncbi:serine-rich adhesin for platelets-like [Montipora capricornis]|uniref:serine-rich adhesin for platelets-like n=1 Tax=Montipora capricornis TaxID=246305 RepID=UPI0035F1E403